MKTWAVVRHALHESVHRTASLATFIASLAVLGLFLLPLRVQDGQAYFWGKPSGVPVTRFAKDMSEMAVAMVSSVWVFLALLGAAGLITSFLQRGWVELFLSKPLRRWSLLAGGYLGGLLLWGFSGGLIIGGFALRMRLLAGVPTGPSLKALAVLTLLFGVLLAFLLLINVFNPNATVAVFGTAMVYFFSTALSLREAVAKYFNSKLLKKALDAAYYILPKVNEMITMAFHLQRNDPVQHWMPLWSSALFGAACIAVAAWRLERTSF